MDRVRRMIGCEHRAVKSYTGKGIYTAILDSGVATHPDLRGRIVAFKDFVSNKRTAYDDNGHGTHVSGILAGNGAASKGKYRGIAPECMLVCGKVLDKEGGGQSQKPYQRIDLDIRHNEKCSNSDSQYIN